MPIPRKVADRIAAGLKRLKQVLEARRHSQAMSGNGRLEREASLAHVILLCCALLVIAIGLAGSATCADPEKDPQGWNGIAFGMTRQQVLAALGGRGHLEHPRNRLKPLMLNTGDCADLPAALAAATQIVDRAGADPKMKDRAVAAENLLDLLKPRDWVILAPSPPQGNNRRKPKGKKVVGTLTRYRSLGFNGIEIELAIEGKNGGLSLRPDSLDDASNQYLDEVDQAVDQLSGMIAEAELAASGEVVIAPVQIRGIELEPNVKFVGDTVTKVSLCTPGADNPLTRIPNLSGMHRTLCDALAEKYGPADERNETDTAFSVVWHFPKTKLSCSQTRFGIWISYVPSNPGGENREQDNL